MTRVLIVASSAVSRAGLEALLSEHPSIEVVGSIPGVVGIAESLGALAPDAILIDVGPGENESEIWRLTEVEAPPAVVVLAEDANGTLSTEALQSGGHAVLPRDARPEEITSAVEAAASGLVVLHPAIARGLLPSLERVPVRDAAELLEALTPRELEILALLAEGWGNKQIARLLGISEHTVKFHVASILGKLGASSRTEAVTIGVRRGLIMV